MAEKTVGGGKMSAQFNYIEALKMLTPKEIEILELTGMGYSGTEIAERLFLSVKTIYKHKENIRKKLNLNGNGHRSLMKWYLQNYKGNTK